MSGIPAPVRQFEMTQTEFAALCGVTVQSLINWHNEERDPMPPARKPTKRTSYYDLKVFIPWVKEHKWLPAQDARARKLEAEASLAEMERDEKAGQLLVAAEVLQGWEDFLVRLRNNLIGFPDRIVPLLAETDDPREQLAIARREMQQTLRVLEHREDEAQP